MAINTVIEKSWWVVYDGNNGFDVYTQKGEQVMGQMFVRVTDPFDGVATMIVKAVVNIAGSKEEMMKKISEHK